MPAEDLQKIKSLTSGRFPVRLTFAILSTLKILLGTYVFRGDDRVAAASKIANLIEVKTALHDKYVRLAKIAGSQAKRDAYLFRSRSYARQVETLRRLEAQAS